MRVVGCAQHAHMKERSSFVTHRFQADACSMLHPLANSKSNKSMLGALIAPPSGGFLDSFPRRLAFWDLAHSACMLLLQPQAQKRDDHQSHSDLHIISMDPPLMLCQQNKWHPSTHPRLVHPG